jgi:Domain of unknown function (DUF1840)
MLYTFKSKTAGDVLMLGPSGEELLRLIGKAPSPKGIIESADMPAAIDAIESAIGLEASQPDQTDAQRTPGGSGEDQRTVSLRQRAWPFVEMMKTAYAAGAAITWGV